LPLEFQARILLQFGDNLPRTHPFPIPVDSLFEEQVPIQGFIAYDRMLM
jgi:hypothetical protein